MEKRRGVSIKVENVSKKFGSFTALDKVDLDIEKGEFFSLLGPSGCGKTTLLRIIAGFESPDSGDLLFDNRSVLSLPPEKRSSNTVFQNYALFPHLNVYDNIAFPLKLRKVDRNTIDEKVRHFVHLVQLDEHLFKKPRELSGGQKQRVAIARALISEPDVLLLDEPLSALDAKLRQNLLIELDDIHDKVGITFIYVTHDQSEALSVSDRIAVMNHARVLQVGSPYEIYEKPRTEFVARFIGDINIYPCTILSCESFEDEYMCKVDCPSLGGDIFVTDIERQEVGRKMFFTIRPEKVRIKLKEEDDPDYARQGLNVFSGIVDEPVYSGFQSRFYVKLENGETVNVMKMHSTYLDDGPEIEWKDSVQVIWRAVDGYLVKEKDHGE